MSMENLSTDRERINGSGVVPVRVTDTRGRPLHDLRISVTDRCNFRCTYCMPKEVFGREYQFLDRREILSFEEITRLTRTFVDQGVEKVRLTGGEPTLRRGLPKLVAMLSELEGVNEHTVVDFARHFKGSGHIVRFIEYMDVGNSNGWRLDDVVTAAEIVAMIDREMPLEPLEPQYRGEVAERYRYRDGSGEIGVIASVSQPFCGDCTRARISADGRLYTCLFGVIGHDLRKLLRSGKTDEEIMAFVQLVWSRRTDRYSELRVSETPGLAAKPEMSYIGG